MKDWYVNSYGNAVHVGISTSITLKRSASKWQVWAYFYALNGNLDDSEIGSDFLIEKDTREECEDFILDLVSPDEN